MPSFRYQSLSLRGQAQAGVLEAPTRAAAVRLLLTRGETATIVEEVDASVPAPTATLVARAGQRTASEKRSFGSGFSLSLGATRPSLGRAEMANLIREIATVLEAGLPLMQALRTVRRQASGRALPVILDYLIERVEAGSPLHVAAVEYGPPFDDMILGMLRAADASGKMHEILHQLADLLERSVELRREVTSALFYPLVLTTLLIGSVIVLVTVLVPSLIAPLAGSMRLPLPTQIVLGCANFLQSYWPHILVAIIAGLLIWRFWIRVPANRVRFDAFKLRIPVVGRLLRDVAVARFTRTLGTLVAAGMPILDSLRVTGATLGNAALEQAIEGVQAKVSSGAALADPLERSGLFPPLLVQVVNLGERSGRLEGMLMHAANAFDRQVSNSLKLFTKALQPIILIVMASMAGFILAAILLPLLELGSMVK
jgi:type II secretory pathway component PulF